MQSRYPNTLIMMLIASLLSIQSSFVFISQQGDEDGAHAYCATNELKSGDSILTPALLNYGLSSFVCNLRDFRRMPDTETTVRLTAMQKAFCASAESAILYDNPLLKYVSMRSHGFAYADKEEDPFSPAI